MLEYSRKGTEKAIVKVAWSKFAVKARNTPGLGKDFTSPNTPHVL
jgi:hypothetical protein